MFQMEDVFIIVFDSNPNTVRYRLQTQTLMLWTIPVTSGTNIDLISIILLFSFLIETSKEFYFDLSIGTYTYYFYIDVCTLRWYVVLWSHLYADITMHVCWIWIVYICVYAAVFSWKKVVSPESFGDYTDTQTSECVHR